jgi:hypothetical protein
MFHPSIFLIMHLMGGYPSADACYDVLEIDLVEHEDQARAEMEWCVNRFKRYYDLREGDTFGYSCREAEQELRHPELLEKHAEESLLTLDELRKVAQDRADSKWCRETHADTLRRRFEEERAQQIAIFDCMSAEERINYGPLGLGPFRKNPVDLECWTGGWEPFYVEPQIPDNDYARHQR